MHHKMEDQERPTFYNIIIDVAIKVAYSKLVHTHLVYQLSISSANSLVFCFRSVVALDHVRCGYTFEVRKTPPRD